jgi:hypothetical protein
MRIAEQNELRADRCGGISARFHFLAGSSRSGDRYQNQQCQPAQLHFDLEAVIAKIWLTSPPLLPWPSGVTAAYVTQDGPSVA